MRQSSIARSFSRPGKWLVRFIALAAGLAVGASAWAGSITRTSAYEYDPVTGYLTAEVSEPDTPQLSVRTAYTLNAFGSRLTATVSSPATGLAAIPTRTVNTITYDGYGQPMSSANALGQVINLAFDSSGQLAYVLNLNGLYTTYDYDSFKRKTVEYRPDGNRTRYDYQFCFSYTNCPPNVKSYTRATPLASNGTQNGPSVTTYFDSLSRPVRTETQGFDGVTLITQDTEYDALGRTSRVSKPYYPNATKQWTTYTYDALGRVVMVTAPDNSHTGTTYNGLTKVATNALNQTQTTLSNGVGQVVRVTDAQGNMLSYQYDAQGNLTKTTDPKSNVVTMVYDNLGRKTSMVDPDLGTTSYVYDALGELVQQTDARNNVTTYFYDLLGRATKRTEADLVATWVYDNCTMGKGRQCRSTADNGYTIDYSFDNQSRPSQTLTHVDANYTTINTYDTNGRVATQTYPTGLVIKYVYTSLGYLKEVRDNASDTLYWQANSMDAEGHLLQQTYGNNVVTQQVFDPATGRVKNIYAGAGNAVQNLSFSFDVRGNMLTRNDANQNLSESFLYDTLNRLTSNTVNSSGAGMVTQIYGYDSIGNITSRSDMGTYTYSANGGARPHAVSQIALTGGGTRQYSYDASGSLVQEVQRDAANNVVAVKGRTETYTSFDMPVTLASPAATLSFVYGPEHQRIKQIAPGATTVYLHPDNNGGLLYEKDIKTDGSVEHKHYITAGGGVVVLLKQTSVGTTALYFHRDHLGSTTAMTNATGTVVERMAYEPFGKRRAPAGSLDPNNALVGVVTDRGYTNHEHLDELGLIHMNGRVYEPSIGRFISADPNVPYPTNIQSYNRYSYTRNNPLISIDPSGFIDTWNNMPISATNHPPPGWIPPGAITYRNSDPLVTPFVGSITSFNMRSDDPSIINFGQSNSVSSGGGYEVPGGAHFNEDFYDSNGHYISANTRTFVSNFKNGFVQGVSNASQSRGYPDVTDGTADKSSTGYLLGIGVGTALVANAQFGGRMPARAGVQRLPQDINVNSRAPGALPTNRPIGLSPTQNAEAQKIVSELKAAGYTDIRVNQQQVSALGARVGVNRPDIQATSPGGQRVHYELDTASSNRGAGHETRIMANDPAANVILITVD